MAGSLQHLTGNTCAPMLFPHVRVWSILTVHNLNGLQNATVHAKSSASTIFKNALHQGACPGRGAVWLRELPLLCFTGWTTRLSASQPVDSASPGEGKQSGHQQSMTRQWPQTQCVHCLTDYFMKSPHTASQDGAAENCCPASPQPLPRARASDRYVWYGGIHKLSLPLLLGWQR